MPHKKAAYKEIRRSKKRHSANVALKTELKTVAKKFEKLVSDKKIDEAKAFLKAVVSKFDKAVVKGIVHRNTASRTISRYSKKLVSPKA